VSNSEKRFEREVLEAVTEIGEILPHVLARYTKLVAVAALAEHMGGALHFMLREGEISAMHAALVLQRITTTAFAGAPPQAGPDETA